MTFMGHLISVGRCLFFGGLRRGSSGAAPHIHISVLAAATLATTIIFPTCASAQQPEALPQGGASPGSADSIPTDKPSLRAFCVDRPAQATLPCTVDKGHLQLETDILNVTHDTTGGVTTDTYLYTNPTLKLGVADRTDIEISMTPYEMVRVHNPLTGQTSSSSGAGDLTISLKQNIFGDYKGPLAVTIELFVKAPTAAHGVGDGAWEGGVLTPVAFGFGSLVLNLTPEVDVRENAIGGGMHLEPVGIINIAFSLPANLGLSTELYVRNIRDPIAPMTKISADLGLALSLKNDLQLDIGVNLGLNSETAPVQTYFGISKRY